MVGEVFMPPGHGSSGGAAAAAAATVTARREGAGQTDGDAPAIEDVEDDSDIAHGRHGLILWSDPWDVNSWELTPGFLRKWSWIVEGCPGVIEATNRWRALRNEEPLCVELL